MTVLTGTKVIELASDAGALAGKLLADMGADVVLVSYGITARVARMGQELARKKGIKVGFIRLIVAWPFPEKRIRDLAGKIKGFVVPEINLGQMVLEVERCSAGKTKAICVPHSGGGVHDPQDICDAIVRAAK
mgnify:CR=1 FL=1